MWEHQEQSKSQPWWQPEKNFLASFSSHRGEQARLILFSFVVQAGVGIIFAGLENRDYLFVDSMVREGPAEISRQV